MQSFKFQKHVLTFLVFLILSALSGCNFFSYPQSVLRPPTKIVVEIDQERHEITSDEPAYTEIQKALEQNWWKTMQKEELKDCLNGYPKILALCDEELLSSSNVKIHYVYDSAINWFDYSDTKKTLKIQEYLFLLPTQDGSNTQGEFLISETHEFLGFANRYEYYYSQELYDVINRLEF